MTNIQIVLCATSQHYKSIKMDVHLRFAKDTFNSC